jgi:Arc/MetJ-type ribon-helix-helix transcriptional regulator
LDKEEAWNDASSFFVALLDDLGMVFGMATTKITVTLEDEQIMAIRSLVTAGEAANISAFVKHAVGIALSDAAGWKEMLDEALQQTGGPLTAEEKTWADSILSPRDSGGGGKRKGKAA